MTNQEYLKQMEKSESDFQAAKAIFSAAIHFAGSADKKSIEYALDVLKTVKKNESALYLAVELTIEHCNTRLEKLASMAD
jgi:hypothetical protein